MAEAIAAAVVNLAGLTGTAATIANAVVQVGIYAAANAIVTQNSEQKEQGGLIDLQLNSSAPRQLVIGKRMTGGVLIDWYLAGTNNTKLYLPVYLSEGPCGQVTRVFADGREVWSTPLVHGTRTTIPDFRSGGDRLWLTYYDGRVGQSADATLVALGQGWTSANKMTGCAWVLIECQWDSDNMRSPPSLSFEMEGAKLYDRRKDSTAGGSGSHRIDNPATWEFSDNPAVALDHYMLGRYWSGARTFGIGLSADEVPYSYFAAQANVCDEDVDLKAGGTQKRYRANGFILASEDYSSVITKLCTAMAARPADFGGRFGVIGVESKTPVLTIDDGDLIAGVQEVYTPKRSWAELVGEVEGRFQDPAQLYQPTPYPNVTDASWEAEDGGEPKLITLDLEFETNVERAQRLALLKARQERRQATLRGVYPLWTVELERGDWFVRTGAKWGGGGKTFEVIERVLDPATYTVTIVSQEVDAADSAWDENVASDGPPAPIDPTDTLSAVTAPSLTVTSNPIVGAASNTPAIKVAFTNPTDPRVHTMFIEVYRDSDALKVATVPVTIPDADGEVIIQNGIADGVLYDVRAKYLTPGLSSAWSTTQSVTTGATYAVGEADSVAWSNVTDDGGRPDDNADVTAANTAAAITGQGALATSTLTEVLVRNDAVANSLSPDPNFMDPTSYTNTGGSANSNFTRVSVDSPGGPYALQCAAANALAWYPGNRKFVFDRERVYEASFWRKRVSGDRRFYSLMQFYDKDGALITGTSLTGWPAGTYPDGGNYYFDNALLPVTSWTRINVIFGAAGAQVPSNAVYASIGFLFNYSDGTTDGLVQCTGVRCEELRRIGTNLYRADGSLATEAMVVTLLGTAAAITGQAAAATDSTIQAGATKNTLTFNASAPSSPTNGDIWVDTSALPYVIKTRVIGVWEASGSYGGVFGGTLYEAGGGAVASLANFKTALGTAAAIAGQAAAATDATIQPGATKNTLTFNSSAPSSPTNGDIWVDTSSTPYVIKTRVSGAWQTSASYGGVFGGSLYEAGGGAVASLANFKTVLGTAAAIAGQGTLATLNTVLAEHLAAGVGGNAFVDPFHRRISDTSIYVPVNGSGLTLTDQNVTALDKRQRLIILGAGTPAAAAPIGFYQQPTTLALPVVAGQKVEASAYVGGYGLSAIDVYVFWVNSSGAIFSSLLAGRHGTHGAVAGMTKSGGGGDLANYERIGGVVTAPSGAVGAVFGIYGYTPTVTVVTGAYFYMMQPMIAYANANQTEISRWTPGLDAQPGADVTSGNTAAAISGQGALATLNAAGTSQIAANAVTQGIAGETDAAVSVLSSSWVELEAENITVADAAALVKIDWSFFVAVSGEPEDDLLVRIKRGSTVIYETTAARVPAMFSFFTTETGQMDFAQTFTGQVSGFDTDTPGAAGTYTYTLEAKANLSTIGPWSIARRRLFLMQFKR